MEQSVIVQVRKSKVYIVEQEITRDYDDNTKVFGLWNHEPLRVNVFERTVVAILTFERESLDRIRLESLELSRLALQYFD